MTKPILHPLRLCLMVVCIGLALAAYMVDSADHHIFASSAPAELLQSQNSSQNGTDEATSQNSTRQNDEPSPTSQLAADNNEFALDLYQAIRGQEGNLLYSPYSISSALGMAFAGARNNTETQMATVLHFGLPQAELHSAFGDMNSMLNALDNHDGNDDGESDGGESDGSFALNIGNSMWGQQQFGWLDEFLTILTSSYGAEMQQVDFVDSAAREEARQAINQWVSDLTNGLVDNVVSEDVLNDATRLVLANAIYFNAEWDGRFYEQENNASFNLLNGESLDIPLMRRRDITPYMESTGYQAIALPYKGGRTEMIIILPDEGQFEAIEEQLDLDFINQTLTSFQTQDVAAFIPKFSYDANLELGQTLIDMGMHDAFSDQADFSGMTNEQELKLADALHQTAIRVDELGTEAAATTVLPVEFINMPTWFTADRPFIYLIREVETESILFMGRVLNPSDSETVRLAATSLGPDDGGGTTPIPAVSPAIYFPIVKTPTIASALRAAWVEQEPSRYQYRQQIFCFCIPPREAVITVENGEISSAVDPETDEAIDAVHWSRFKTIDELFDLIIDAENRGAESISVDYDDATGIPTRISIDYDSRVIDEEIGYTISEYSAGE